MFFVADVISYSCPPDYLALGLTHQIRKYFSKYYEMGYFIVTAMAYPGKTTIDFTDS